MGALPSRKILSASRPPTAAEINLNFTALWNLLTNGIDSTNAPTLLSKVNGGDISAILRVLGHGLVIGDNAAAPAGAAGKIIISNAAARLVMACGVSGSAVWNIDDDYGTTRWAIGKGADGHFYLTPIIANGHIVASAPIYFSGAGEVYKTEEKFIGAVNLGGVYTKDYLFSIPNDLKRVSGVVKVRCILLADGIRPDSQVVFKYQWGKSGDAISMSGVQAWANFASTVGVYVSEWKTITQPIATDQFLAMEFANPNTVTVNYSSFAVELQYLTDRNGNDDADAT